ncbi:MAG: gamma-glutamylcyclotransferase [Deltaproteobacteria bacterium]|nr:gamma-glutamylcyclotransferase [Deltaproteobacteria bacterium]
MAEALWVFGYGSLVWRPAFPYTTRQPALVHGFVRRFWQASTDHRGTPDAPGRVATLIEQVGASCHGMAYQVEHERRERVLARLDHREQGGYQRVDTALHLHDGRQVEGLVYIATADNPNYVGPAPLEEIASIARTRVGPSGPNSEYVLRLHQALVDIGATDEHVEALARLVGGR